MEQSNCFIKLSAVFDVYIYKIKKKAGKWIMSFQFVYLFLFFWLNYWWKKLLVEKKDVDGKSDLNFRPSAFRFGKRGSVYSDDTAAGLIYTTKS